MVTPSFVDCAGCNARKIFPGGGGERSSPGVQDEFAPSNSLMRSAETASSAGSSRTKSVLVAISGRAASPAFAAGTRAGDDKLAGNAARQTRVGNEVCARANSGKTTRQRIKKV